MNKVDPRENPHWITETLDLREVLTPEVLRTTLADIVEERDLVLYDNEKPVNVDPFEAKGSAAARVVNGVLRKTKNRRSSERSQAISVSQGYIAKAKEGQARADNSHHALLKLNAKFRGADEGKVVELLLDEGDEERARYVEALGIFAKQLDEKKKLQTKDGRGFVDLLNDVIDADDEVMIIAFAAAAEVNSRGRMKAFSAQESDFAYFLNGLLNNSEAKA